MRTNNYFAAAIKDQNKKESKGPRITSDQLQEDIDAFLDAGGKIEQVDGFVHQPILTTVKTESFF